MLNSARYLKAHAPSNGKLGAVGFCWGGGMVNQLAVALGPALQAGVAFYGAAPPHDAVAQIRAPLLLNFADQDPRINAMWPGYEAALKAAGVRYEAYRYPATQHGFHNNSTPRYREEAAQLAWTRTIAFFRTNLS